MDTNTHFYLAKICYYLCNFKSLTVLLLSSLGVLNTWPTDLLAHQGIWGLGLQWVWPTAEFRTLLELVIGK